MSFWASLDHLLDTSAEMQKPNPFPPLGSGKLSRPPMLLVPDFSPPPPTPSPLYVFQLPNVMTKSVWNPAPERKRRLKVWDLLPDPPASAEPQKRLPEPQGRTQKSEKIVTKAKVSAPPMKLPRQPARANLSSLTQADDLSPAAVELLEQVMGCGTVTLQASTGANQLRRPRDGLHCGVDLSALWGVLVDFVFSPVAEKGLPCPCARSQSDAAVRCTVDEVEATVEPKYRNSVQEGTEKAFQHTKGPLQPLRQEGGKGRHSSPMSVLTPLSTEKSSADSSPWHAHSLLAFVGRDSSP